MKIIGGGNSAQGGGGNPRVPPPLCIKPCIFISNKITVPSITMKHSKEIFSVLVRGTTFYLNFTGGGGHCDSKKILP